LKHKGTKSTKAFVKHFFETQRNKEYKGFCYSSFLKHKGTKNTKAFVKQFFETQRNKEYKGFCYSSFLKHKETKSTKAFVSLSLYASKNAKPKEKNFASFVPLWFKKRQTKRKKLCLLCPFVVQKTPNQKKKTLPPLSLCTSKKTKSTDFQHLGFYS
jgi:hypothetical protein